MIEDGARENETVGKSHRNANRNPIAYIAQHAARRGTVKINRVAKARE